MPFCIPKEIDALIDTSDFRNGLSILLDNEIYTIIEFQHVKPGKGNAFVRCRMKALRTGRVLEHTFPSGHEIVTARVIRKPYQYLYKDDSGYNFMDQETFDQISIEEKMIENSDFLREGDTCEVLIHEETGQILSCELPAHVVLEVTLTDDNAVAGNTSTNATKAATLETGSEIQVPLFVKTGDKIKIDTRTREYVERVKDK
ncbi:MAG: elongation factor P [Chitinophagales bacterium]|nr:elongation factor P [Chitinophagales bacterium]MDW8419842.1 elongation factor P [Chitinophagales bacterium]